MKKYIALLLTLVLLCGMFIGCSAKETSVPHSHEDLTIRIPVDFIDLSDEEFAEGLSFVYALDPIAVNGLREPKATFEAYGLDLDLEQYGKFLMMSNQVNAELSKKDDVRYFSYEADAYTYVVTLWETESAFWTVQAYCPTADYSKVKGDMWEILRSVTV